MPAYNTPPYSVTAYAGDNAYVVGYPAITGGPSGTNVDRPETIVASYASIPFCVPSAFDNKGYTQRQITWQIVYGTAPTAISLILQGSITDVPAEYTTLDTSTSLTGETRTIASNYRFFRVLLSSVTGTTTAVIKITCL